MVGAVVWAVIDPVASLLAMALWLRLWLSWERVGGYHPIVRVTRQLTQWLVGPLQRLLPTRGRLDAAALILSALIAVLHVLVMLALFAQSAGALSAPSLTRAASLLLLVLRAVDQLGGLCGDGRGTDPGCAELVCAAPPAWVSAWHAERPSSEAHPSSPSFAGRT